MNQFKDIFTGKKKAEYKRAVTVQKCMRAGGKHNDLENVGRTGRHHTFFEMLGNFSFGDYFKEEAITYGWDWVTRILKLPADRLYATVYEDDDEAFRLWEKIAPELRNGRILRFGKKDNYWSMGDIGPNGPCSEIHFDRGREYSCGKPTCTVNCDCERYVEIWNLVFMQFNTRPDGAIETLPEPSVDTGAGLERITTIMQNVPSNYETDIFWDILELISQLSGKNYSPCEQGVSHRVIADHLRALTFCIADGAGLSKEGRGYVLRRILRRAARHGRLLDLHEPFIYKLVPTLVNMMGKIYPEIKKRQAHIENVIRAEEESFGRTLDNGLELFEDIARKVSASGNNIIPGEEIFRLYDTYGFPADLTQVMAEEKGLKLDLAGFEKAMERQQEKSRSASDFSTDMARNVTVHVDSIKTDLGGLSKPTDFARQKFVVNTIVQHISYQPHPEVGIVVQESPFYVEAGGQISDTGTIKSGNVTIEVHALANYQGSIIHVGRVVSGSKEELISLIGKEVTVSIDAPRRWDIMRNHTATHLLHAALRKVLGGHVHQSGSYVGPDKLRFDFSHFKPMTPDEIAQVEKMVNEKILEGKEVHTDADVDIETAKKSGAMAIFGEKYGSKVRVVSVDDFSKELCGGTHVENVSQIGPFIITLETGIAAGIRRIEAITGRAALEKIQAQKAIVTELSRTLNRSEEEIKKAVEELQKRLSELQKENKKLKSEKFAGGSISVGQEVKLGALTFRFHNFGDVETGEMAGWVDSGKSANSPIVTAAIGYINGKATFMASSSPFAELDIGKFSKEILSQFGGRGGGKVNFAQGTVPADIDPDQLFKEFENKLREQIKANRGSGGF